MTWLIIFLVVALIAGPILYLLPNERDTRLTALRAVARAQGLSIQITSVAKLDPSAAERVSAGGKRLQPKTACAGYKLPIGRQMSISGEFMLIKLPPSPSVVVDEVLPGVGLSLESDKRLWARYSAGGNAAELIQDAFRRLPADTLAIALESRNVVCFWQEKAKADEGQVEVIRAVLGDLRDDLQARFGTV